MITEYYKLSGIDKVAVLFSVIGESVAVRLLKTLSESDIRRIRARSREMDTVSVSLKKQILDEFYLAVMSQKLKNEGESESKKPFDFIHDLADEQLIALLEVEEPRIIAIALAQVKSEQQIKVLDRLSPEIKGLEISLDDSLELVKRISHLDVDFIHLSCWNAFKGSISYRNNSKTLTEWFATNLNNPPPIISMGKVWSHKDAQNLLNLSNFALSSLWQQWRDEASWVNQSSENLSLIHI